MILRSVQLYKRSGQGASYDIFAKLSRDGKAKSSGFWLPWRAIDRNPSWREVLNKSWNLWKAIKNDTDNYENCEGKTTKIYKLPMKSS